MTPALVLPSSLGTTAALWDSNTPYWSRAFRLFPYTQPGRGSVEELGLHLLELAHRERLERFSVCGLSLGGATAMWVAANAPDRVERLVLACTSARFGRPGPWLERAARVRRDGLEALADGILARWFAPGERAEVVARFRRLLVETPREVYATQCEALAGWDFRDRVAEIRAPTLVIAGAEDAATPPAHAARLAAATPDSRLAVIPETSHLANVARPAEFSLLVADHLAAVEVG